MKTFALATLLGTVFSGAALAQNLTELDRQLTIMSGVIDTALKQDTRKDSLRYRSISATYLARQGVVFNIRTGGMGRIFDFDLGSLLSVVPGAPPAPPAPGAQNVTIVTDSDYEFIHETDWEETANRVIRKVEHIVRETDDRLREFRSDQREVEWEMRELERRNRDIEFEIRTADSVRQKELKEELKALESELEHLKVKEQEIAEHAKKIAAERNAELAKQKQAQEEAHKVFLANFEASIGDTLCSFGAGLRELPDNQHITFVLDDFAKNDEGGIADRVYIFNKKDVKRCVTEDISAGDLLTKAEVYTF